MRGRLSVLVAGLLALLALTVPLRAVEADQGKKIEAPQKELEALWADLYDEEFAAANAVLRLYKHGDAAVPFLKAKLQPLKLDADRCRELLKELGDKNEAVWKEAWDALDYLDPRLAIDLQTLMGDITDVPARTRMVELCSQRLADSLAGKDVMLRPAGEGFNFYDGRGSWWAEHRIEQLGKRSWQAKKAWTRAARAVAVLEHIGTPDAIEVLQQLAAGHADALPTKAAKESLMRLKAMAASTR